MKNESGQGSRRFTHAVGWSQRRLWAWACCLALAAGSVYGAETARPDGGTGNTAPAPVVGPLGRKEALRFQGNETFSKEQLLLGLSWQIDFHLAAHPRAPLAEYLALLEKLLTRGYQHAGFAAPTVRVAVDTNANQLAVAIHEGTRYRSGPLLLSGIPSMTNDTLRQALAERLAGIEPGPAATTNQDNLLWQPGQWAPLEPTSRERLERAVQKTLQSLGYVEPEMEVRLLTDPQQKLVTLSIAFTTEGVPLILQEIEINGLRTNTRAQVLDYLKLKPGARVAPDLTSQVETQLWRSARFLHHEATLQPLPEPGKVQLLLDLEELRGPPSLSEEFSPEAKATLRFRDWLAHWLKGADDMRLTINVGSSPAKLQMDAALSGTGFVLAGRSTAPDAQLAYAAVVSSSLKGLYSLWRGDKYVSQSDAGWRVEFRLVPRNINFNVGFVNARGLHVEFELSPAAFMDLLYQPGTTAALDHGILSLTYSNETNTAWRMRVDAPTGRLFELTAENPIYRLRLHPEEGAFARLVSEIGAASRAHTNSYHPGSSFSSWLSFVATDLVESKWIEQLLQDQPKSESATPDATLADLRSARSFLVLARALIGKESLGKVFEPLNRLAPAEQEQDEDNFVIMPDKASQADNQSSMAVIAAYLLFYVDSLVGRDSWLATLSRESLLTMAGQGRYTEVELNRFLTSDEVGPAACLVTAYFLGRLNPKAARAVAERGLSRLSSAALKQDYQVLFQNSSILAEMVDRALGALQNLGEAEVTQLTSFFPSASGAWVRDVARRVHENPGASAAQAAWPAWESHWDDLLRPALQSGLNHFLPQVKFLTDPTALYERGLSLIDAKGAFQDSEEAAASFRKAAEMGHGGAQLQLGALLERGQGVTQDYAQALRWYKQAAEQKTPHATCRLGALYTQGLGVDKDLEQAVRWLRVEAEMGCSGAQHYLGRVCEEQLKIPDALQWYRRAATGGDITAQARLGDLLSDGFSAPTDYLEACQWLLLATRQGGEDRLSEHRLRRVKAKLTTEQLHLAEDRADKLRQQLDKQEADRKQNGH